MTMRTSPFFEEVRQIDIEIGGQPGKTPTFYYDGASMTAVFPARYRRLRELMPDRRYVPARLAPGLGVLAITCFEYRDTDVGPYNELAIAIPLNEPYFRANLPARALIEAARTGQQHAHTLHLPVTTNVALRGGVDFYNFPKFIARIDHTQTDGEWRCRLAEGQEHILTLSGRRISAPRSQQAELFCHLWMDGQPQTAQFKINQLEVGSTWRRDAATLELGERHPVANELRQLIVSRKPLQYEYNPRLEAILFGPEHMTLPLVQRGLAAAQALHEHAAG
jgi:Acetoacetate decarboxylase (ADC)